MAINKSMKLALKAISYPDIDIKKTYKIKRQIQNVVNPSLKLAYKVWDHKVLREDYEVPVRLFLPRIHEAKRKAFIFFHGGGWVIGNIDNYNKVCSIMARETGHLVISVDYRLAPENKFPIGLEDCYAVVKEIFMDRSFFDIDPEDITLIGDSAGGNLAAAVSLMAKDKGEFMPSKQILIYPGTNNNYGEDSPFPSIHEKGTDYLLTSKRMCDYMQLYINDEEDLKSPYLAPLLAEDLRNQPKTLIITAEHDPLRDEGEAYGKKLKEAGNDVEILRMKNALHGFISLPKHFVHVKRTYERINEFIGES